MSKKRFDLIYAGKQVAYIFIKYSGGFALSKRLSRRGLRILCYHGIWPEPNWEHNLSDALFMTPETFENRMAFLTSQKYPIVGLDDAVKKLKNNTLPDYATVITIDDGWYNSYRYMLPVFDRYSMKATLYLTTYFMQHQEPITQVAIRHIVKSSTQSRIDLNKLGIGLSDDIELTTPAQREVIASRIYGVVDKLSRAEQHRVCTAIGDLLQVDYESMVNERLLHLMNAEEVQDASERGYDIQLHTHRHRINIGETSCLSDEIIANRKALDNLTTQPLNHFCYPSGVYSSSYWPELENLGVASATTCDGGLNYADTNMFQLKRILDSESKTNLDIEAELCGFRDVLSNVRRSIVETYDAFCAKIRRPLCSSIINRMSRSEQNAKLLVFCFDTAITHHTESGVAGISPELFKKQISWLANHYHILPLSDAVNLCRAGKLDKPTACITFDHDFKSYETIAASYLKAQNIPATFFTSNQEFGQTLTPEIWVSLFNSHGDRKSHIEFTNKLRELTGQFDYEIDSSNIQQIADCILKLSTANQRSVVELIQSSIPDTLLKNLLLSEDDVLNLHASGFSLGGCMHEILDAESDACLSGKVAVDLKRISQVTNSEVRSFSYRKEIASLGFFDQLGRLLFRHNIVSAVTNVGGYFSPGCDPMQIPRVRLQGSSEMNFLKTVLSAYRSDYGILSSRGYESNS